MKAILHGYKILELKVHSREKSATTSKNDFPIEVYVAVEAIDPSVHVNRSICCHRTQCLPQEQIDLVARRKWAFIQVGESDPRPDVNDDLCTQRTG